MKYIWSELHSFTHCNECNSLILRKGNLLTFNYYQLITLGTLLPGTGCCQGNKGISRVSGASWATRLCTSCVQIIKLLYFILNSVSHWKCINKGSTTTVQISKSRVTIKDTTRSRTWSIKSSLHDIAFYLRPTKVPALQWSSVPTWVRDKLTDAHYHLIRTALDS